MTDAEILAAYLAVPNAALQAVLLAEYRCREGCLLLHVWQSPDGPMYYRPRARRPREQSFPTEGRAELPAHAGMLDYFDTTGAPGAWGDDPAAGIRFNGPEVGCGHLWGQIAATEILADITDAAPGRPTVRFGLWGRASLPATD